jgi:hypothetical protein
VPPKRCYLSTELHENIAQNTAILKLPPSSERRIVCPVDGVCMFLRSVGTCLQTTVPHSPKDSNVNTRESQQIGHKWIQNVKHVIFEPERDIYFSIYPPPTLIHCRNLQNRSLLTVVNHFRTWSRIICDFRTSLREFLDPVANRFNGQTLLIVNRKHLFTNILCIESFPPQKQNRMLLFGSIHSSTVAVLTTQTSL